MEIAPYHFMIAKNMRAKRCKAAREPECFQERESAKRGAFRSLISVAAKHMRRGVLSMRRSARVPHEVEGVRDSCYFNFMTLFDTKPGCLLDQWDANQQKCIFVIPERGRSRVRFLK